MLKELRGQVFVFIGIVGCALTIVSHWANAVHPADWMRWIVAHWLVALQEFWDFWGSLIGTKVSLEGAKLLSLISFYVSLTLGSILSGVRRRHTKRDIYFMMPAAVFWAITVGFTAIRIGGIPNLPATMGFFILYVLYVSLPIALYAEEDKSAFLFIITTALVLMNIGLFSIGFIYVINLTNGSSSGVYVLILLLVSSLMFLAFIVPIIFVPNGALIRRTAVLLLTVGAMFGLNEISKFAAKIQPPANFSPRYREAAEPSPSFLGDFSSSRKSSEPRL